MAEEKQLTKLVRPLPKGQITLPVEFRRQLKIDQDTILSLTLEGGKIVIVPLRPVPPEEALREYSAEELERFRAEDRLDAATVARVRRLLREPSSA